MAELAPESRVERRNDDFSDRLITISDPGNPASEAYRTLRTSLLYALVDEPPKVIVMTSPGPGEGKSTTCANLAITLSQADKNVLLIDCDLRKPVMHKVFGLRNFVGVVNVIVGERKIEDVWQEPYPGLKVVTVGTIPPNPSELIGSKRFGSLLADLRERFDYILIDAPPTQLVSDPAILATQGDGILLVLDSQKTRKGILRQAVRDLEKVGARVLGTVMNNVKVTRGSYYGYRYE